MARIDVELLEKVTVSRNPSFEQCASKKDEEPSPPGGLCDSKSHEGCTGEGRKRLFPVRDVE